MTARDVAPTRCPAKVLMLDDRWGGIEDRCDLEENHAGDHRSARDACMPRAYLGWSDLQVGADEASPEPSKGDSP